MPVLSSSLALGKHGLLLAAAIAVQQADQVQNTTEASLPGLWDCLSSPALLMEPSSQQSPANGEFCMQNLVCSLRRAQASSWGQKGSPARTPGSRRDRVGFYTLSRLEDSVLCPIPSSHHPPAGRQRLEPRSLC